MDLKAQLLLIAAKYGELTGRGQHRVSTLALNQGMRLSAYASGKLSPSVKTFERAMVWFSTNWPPEDEWPFGIHRPTKDASVSLEANKAAALGAAQ